MQKKLQTDVSQLLENAEQFAQQGKRQKAYQLSLQATMVAPNEPLAWYLRSRNAASTEERLMCLSRAYSLDPDYADTQNELRSAVRMLLKQEPFLAYVYETPEFYQVRSGRELLVNIPKNRTFETPYLKKKPGLAHPAYRWLSLALVGLLLGGVGAVLLAPITAFQALRLQTLASSRPDQARLWVAFGLAVLIWLISIPISWLLLIRLFPS